MKNFKKILALLLAVAMLCCVLTACGEKTENAGGEAVYRVKVVDGAGNPVTDGVIVKFMQGDTQAAMQPVNGEGVAEKTLQKGDYTVELMFTGGEAKSYDTAAAVLSAEQTAVEIKLFNGLSEHTVQLMANGKERTAHYVSVGSTRISVEANDRNYFLFTPTEAGTYRFSVDNNDLKIGYYGGSIHFIWDESMEEITDNSFTISVSASMIGTGETGTTVIIVGVDGVDAKTDCVLTIVRTGEAEQTIEDMPWTEYKTTATLKPFTFKPTPGMRLVYVDIKDTAKREIIFNETDGLYHHGTADGPVVYMNLGMDAPNVSLQRVIKGEGAMGGAPVRKYFFDENGEFIKKEDYTDILCQYFDNMDEELGLYPLTADLVYIIQNGCSGWWTETDPNYIFEGCNPENGWMFALCYETQA